MLLAKIINKKSGLQTHGGDFASQEELQKWIDSNIAQGEKCPWGRPEWTEIFIDENGVETRRETHPAEFDVVIEDKTAEREADRQVARTKLSELQRARSVLESKELSVEELRYVLSVLVDREIEKLEPATKSISIAEARGKK